MKRIFTLAAFVASTLIANAQKGTVLVGGNIGIETNSNDESFFDFSPYVGYQFTKNWTAGIAADVTSRKSDDGMNEYKTSAFAVGPFLRYTQPVSDIFSIFGQFEAKYASSKYKFNGTTVNEASGFGLSLYPAVFVNVKNGFGLNLDFGGINYVTVKPEGGSSENAFQFNFGRTINIGVSKNFGGKK